MARQTGPVATIAVIRIRPAEPHDIESVTELLSEAAAWTAAIGFPNWPAPFPREVVAAGVERRDLSVADLHVADLHVADLHVADLYVDEGDESIVAAVTLQWSDEFFWGEQPDDAGYVHRLVVRRDRAGTGIGAALMDWASERVRATGRTRLRLDASADNLPLGSFYERLGFTCRGERAGELTEPDGGIRRWKTRLYERDCNEENPR